MRDASNARNLPHMFLMRMDRFLRDGSGVQNTAGYQIELRSRSSISRVNLGFSFPESVGLLNLDM
jgi:hypothetical protein